MKRIATLVIAFALTAATVSAQIAPGMKYKELKNIYNAKEYVKSQNDPYSKGWSGFASFVMPGLGQLIDGEVGRGIAIIGGNIAINSVGYYCAGKMVSYLQKDASGNYMKDSDGHYIFTDEKAAAKWLGGIIAAGLGATIYDIWNICDAVKVAKVKNMYYQDLTGKRAMEFSLTPSFDYAMTADGTQPVAGMTLALRF